MLWGLPLLLTPDIMACGSGQGTGMIYHPDFFPTYCVANETVAWDCDHALLHTCQDYLEGLFDNPFPCIVDKNTSSSDAVNTEIDNLDILNMGIVPSTYMIYGVSITRLRLVHFTQPLVIHPLAFFVGKNLSDMCSGTLIQSVSAALNPLSPPLWALLAFLACLWLPLLFLNRGPKGLAPVFYGVFCALVVELYKANLAASVIAPSPLPEPFSSIPDLAHKHVTGQLTFAYYAEDYAYRQIEKLSARESLAKALRTRPPRLISPITSFCDELSRNQSLVTIGDNILDFCDSTCLYRVRGVVNFPMSMGSFTFSRNMDCRKRDKADALVEFARTSAAFHKSRVGALPQCLAGEWEERMPYSTLQVLGPILILPTLQSMACIVLLVEKNYVHIVMSIYFHSIYRHIY